MVLRLPLRTIKYSFSYGLSADTRLVRKVRYLIFNRFYTLESSNIAAADPK